MDILSPTLPFIIWLQSFPFLKWPMLLFSALGSTYLYLVALAILYWCINRRIGLDVGFLMLANAIVNNLIKVLFALPRPYWIYPSLQHFSNEAGFGLPSGHAQGAILFWLFLALQLPAKRRPWAIAGALVISALIGLSRIYLAVHFPADVIVGFALGLLILGIYLRCEHSFRSWFSKRTDIQKIALAVLSVFFTLLCFALLTSPHHQQMFPPFDAESLSWINITGYTGAIFGLVVGVIYRPPVAKIPRNKVALLLRVITGAAVLVMLWFGMARLTTGNEIIVTLGLRFFRDAIISWWIVCGAPWLFFLWEKYSVANV